MIKNRHKSGIIISNSPKLMINLVKVHLDISLLFTKDGLKNLLNFSYIKEEIAFIQDKSW
jgi:hypothetical protein